VGAFVVTVASIILAKRLPLLSPLFSVLFSLSIGALLAAVSLLSERMYGNNIVGLAVIATASVALAILFVYRSKTLTVGPTYRRILVLSLLAYVLVLIKLSVVRAVYPDFFSGFAFEAYFGFAAIGVVIASLFLLMDYDDIYEGVNQGIRKRFEWLLAFSLVLGMLWLYIKILLLLRVLLRFG